MARSNKWQDDYWLLLMQIYLQKPVGTKPMYSRAMVELALELHISPERLHDRMRQLAKLKTPRIERLWKTYSGQPNKLARAVRLLREMNGFNNADAFYDGVEVNESFERDFRPVVEGEKVTPVMLTLILELYFRLTPNTMVPETPEVKELAKLIKLEAQEIAEILGLLQHCDPYLNRRDTVIHPLLPTCHDIWRRYGNDNVEELVARAEMLKEFFK